MLSKGTANLVELWQVVKVSAIALIQNFTQYFWPCQSLFIQFSCIYLPQSEIDCCIPCAISDFRSEVDENCDLLDYYATSNCNFLRTIQDNL
jgi:hypothetical protein